MFNFDTRIAGTVTRKSQLFHHNIARLSRHRLASFSTPIVKPAAMPRGGVQAGLTGAG